ncbi:MAG: WecB/TagA/CpsF family glycosyltransferase [Myxococcaceae bacterium]|nr:WecB/TagA/CpsF family glycosyltransferase [Myxococcaceae bacterium]MCI0669383.1 WecB/TagA/CpsF family glycosyltransferase [Myxococcaceae bacterium]
MTALPSAPALPSGTPRRRVRVGSVDIDVLTFDEAVDAIEALVERGAGGSVFTPNVDHIVTAEEHAEFRASYAAVSLSLVDGTPVLWASRLLGVPLPEKVSGSDLVLPLMERAAARRWRVFLTGAGPGVAERAASVMRSLGVDVVGVDAPRISASPGEGDEASVAAERVAQARPDLVLVAFGAPKQELWIHRYGTLVGPAVFVAVGASLDFIAGTVRRAPAWMSRMGLEWLYRLSREPRRLWRRYLVNDPKFLLILARALATPRASRVVLRG